MSKPSLDTFGRLKLTSNPTTVSISGTTARNGTDLDNGLYEIYSNTDCFILQGDSSVTATTSSNPLVSGVYATVHVDAAANARIAGITSGASGTLYIIKRNQ